MSDRTTYRTYEIPRLIDEAKYNPNRELAIALGERLADLDYELDERVAEKAEYAADLQRELNKLDDKVYELQVEIDKLEMMLEERDRIIEELKKGN